MMVDRSFQHSECRVGLSTIGKMPGEEVVDFGVVVDFDFRSKGLDLGRRCFVGTGQQHLIAVPVRNLGRRDAKGIGCSAFSQ